MDHGKRKGGGDPAKAQLAKAVVGIPRVDNTIAITDTEIARSARGH